MSLAVISRPAGETAVTLTQRFSVPLKTALPERGKKATDLLNLAAVLYQYIQPASEIAFNLCSPKKVYSG